MNECFCCWSSLTNCVLFPFTKTRQQLTEQTLQDKKNFEWKKICQAKKDVKKPEKGNKTRNLRARAGEKVDVFVVPYAEPDGVVKSYHIKV